MKKRVLITGASGFVGFHLIEKALQQEMEVFAAVRSSSKVEHLMSLPVKFINLNLSDKAVLKAQLEENQFDYIIHGAGLTKAKTQQEYDYVNASLSRSLAEASVIASIPLKKFVFISSLAAQGPLNVSSGIIESDSPAHPVTAYGRSKLLAEEYLSQVESLPLVVLRPTAVYGPREQDIYIIISSIAKGLEPYIGRREQKLSFIYVKDLADAVVLALQSEKIGPAAYNVSDGRVYDRYALADIVKRHLGKSTLKFHLPTGIVAALASLMEGIYSFSKKTPALNKEKLNELSAVNWSCGIGNIQRDLNFVPAYDLERGLAETLDWYRANKWI